MPGPELELMPNEKMILHSHPHWMFFFKQVFAGIGVIALFILWVAANGTWKTLLGWLLVIAFVVWLANTVYQFFAWQTTRFAVTDQRVAYQSGMLRRRGVSIPLNRVNNVNFDQTIMSRMFNNGTLTIESASENGDSVFENIPDPETVRNLIFAQMEIDKNKDSERDAAALHEAMKKLPQDPSLTPPAPPAPSTTERLQQLTDLRDKGLVTPEEFEVKRQEIIGNL
jgi:uncharacterized membrane protein YdbT with pleckstrin-like domain